MEVEGAAGGAAGVAAAAAEALGFFSEGGLNCVRLGVFLASNLPLLGMRAACSLQKLMCLSAALSLNLRWQWGHWM